MGFWSNLWIEKATNWASGKIDAPENFKEENVEAKLDYVKIFLKSMYITSVRRGLQQYYGTVHSFITIPHLSGEVAEFQVVTTPNSLTGLTNSNLHKIIKINCPLLGPIPYNGGNINLEIGLFSIPYNNLSDSFLGLLEKMSNTAGISFVSTVIPYAELITDGISALADKGDTNILEIGIKTTLDEPRTGYYFAMAAPKSYLKNKKLKLDIQDFSLIDENKNPITKYSYMVFSVEASKERKTWFLIPEIKTAHQKYKKAAQDKGLSSMDADESFVVLKRTIINSPDLTLDDKIRLINDLKDERDTKLKLMQIKGSGTSLRELEEIDLYPKK